MEYETPFTRMLGFMVADSSGVERFLPAEVASSRRVLEPCVAVAEFCARFPLAVTSSREHFMLLGLDTQRRVRAAEVISVGTINNTLVHPREVFAPLITGACAAFIVGHNHPSGDPGPSSDDLALTRRLYKAGDLMGIPLLDHIILTASGAFTSIRERENSGRLKVAIFRDDVEPAEPPSAPPKPSCCGRRKDGGFCRSARMKGSAFCRAHQVKKAASFVGGDRHDPET